jgi:predicted dehydrogenase
MLNVGLLGAGFGWSVLRPAFERTNYFRVRSVWTQSKRKQVELKSRYPQINVVANWKILLRDNNLDAVLISAPPALQEKMAVEAASFGKPLFLEKPFASTLRGAKTMWTRLSRKPIPVVVDFEFTELPLWKKVKSLLDSGALGRLEFVSVHWQAPRPPNGRKSWKDQSRMGGGLLLNFGSHVADYLGYFLGRINSVATFKMEKSDIHFTATTKTGTAARVRILRNKNIAPRHEILFKGSEGFLLLRNRTIDYMNGFQLEGVLRNGKVLMDLANKNGKKEDGRIEAVRRMAGLFYRQIKSPSLDFLKRGVQSQFVLDALLKSAPAKKAVIL